MYRAYHAIRGLTGPDGESTNAVYGFVTMLRKLHRGSQARVHRGVVRPGGPDVPIELRDDYKANRAPMPSRSGRADSRCVHEACEALGVPILTCAGLRSRRRDRDAGDAGARPTGRPVAIVTGDKDFFQLVGDETGIRVFNPRDEGTWYDAAGVKEKFGVAPDQVVDVLALMGDTIDNIKGVPGIGEKGARDLISTHGSLDALLEHAPDRCRRRGIARLLTTHADSARESRELLRIRTDVPLPEVDVSCFEYRGPNRQKCFELFSPLGFRTLVMEYAPTADTVDTDYTVVTTEADLAALVSELRERRTVCVERHRRLPRRHARVAGRHRVFDRRRGGRGICRSGIRRSTSLRPIPGTRGTRGAEGSAREPGDREDRPRPEVRSDDARRTKASTLTGLDVRHDAGQLRARRDTVEPHASRRSRSSISATRR